MHLPFRSLCFALLLVLIPAVADKLAAADIATTYYGDPNRRPLDGTPRRSRSDDGWSPRHASEPYRPARSAIWYDGVPLPAPIWNGLYAGLHGGGGWGSIDTSLGDLDLSGSLVGAHIGYLMRSGALVAGIEVDGDLSQIGVGLTVAGLATMTANADWLVSARGRVGVLAGPALFYATGGVAVAGLSMQADVGGLRVAGSGTETALVAGGGVEIGLNDNMAFRVEALHYMFDEEKVALPSGLGTASSSGAVTTIRAGLTFFFN